MNYGNICLSAEKVVEILLERKIWVFSNGTHNINKIKPGHKVVLYLAGKGRRFYTTSFEIADNINSHNIQSDNEKEKKLFSIFSLGTNIINIKHLRHPIAITDLKDRLSFITDKKNYGLFLRQSIKIIPEHDFNLIVTEGNSFK